MGRHGYTDEDEYNGQLAMWRGQVASSIRGKRGQAFLRELIEALDAMPEKALIAQELRKDGEVCALGCVGAKRGINLEKLDPEDYDRLASVFGISHQLVQEIEFWNDEMGPGKADTPEVRWQRMRDWAMKNLSTPKPGGA